MSSPYIVPFSEETRKALLALFQEFDRDHDGSICKEELLELMVEYEKVSPYQIGLAFVQLMDLPVLQGKLTFEQFMLWYYSAFTGAFDLPSFIFELNGMEREIRATTEPPACPPDIKESFVHFFTSDSMQHTDKEMKLRFIANKDMMQKQHNDISQQFKRQLSEVFLALRFEVASNAEQLAAKIQTALDQLMLFVQQNIQPLAMFLPFLKVETAHTPTSISVLVECTYPPLQHLYKAFYGLLEAISPEFLAYLSLGVRIDDFAGVLTQDLINTLFGFDASFRIDSLTLGHLKKVLADIVPHSDFMAQVLVFLFEEIKLDARLETGTAFQSMFGTPPIALAQPGSPEALAQANHHKQIMESVQPGSHDLLIEIIRNSVANFEFGIYSPAFALLVNWKLAGLSKFANLIP